MIKIKKQNNNYKKQAQAAWQKFLREMEKLEEERVKLFAELEEVFKKRQLKKTRQLIQDIKWKKYGEEK